MVEVGGCEMKVEMSSNQPLLIDLSTASSQVSQSSRESSGFEIKDDSTEQYEIPPSSPQNLPHNEKLPDCSAMVVTTDTSKLCGWLNITTRAIIKPTRMRWFVFGDSTCKLYYYRNPHDFLPLGEIDVAHATLYFDASNTGKPGCFEIRSEGREYVLEAPDRNLMMYWLTELQTRRRTYTQHRNTMSREKPGHLYSTRRPQNPGGLTGLTTKRESVNSEELNPHDVNIDSEMMEKFTSPSSSITNLQMIASDIRRKGSDKRKSGKSKASTPGGQEEWMVLDQPEVILPPSSPQNVKPPSQSKLRSALRKLNLKKSPMKEESSVMSPVGNFCHRCKQLEGHLELLREEHSGTEDELQALREIVRLQQKELDHQRKEMESKYQASMCDENGLAQMMTKRDKHIVELEYCLATSNEEKAILAQQNRTINSELQTLKEQVSMYEHMLEAKDQVVVKLTNDIFQLEKNNNLESKSMTLPGNTRHATPGPGTLFIESNTKEIERLQDMCRAYEVQHKFLTKEIVELNELRESESRTIKTLSMNLAKKEAEFCHIKSKYLFLLKELKEPMRGGDEKSQDIVNQLLEEAIESENSEGVDYHLTSSGQEYDRYGFVKKYYEDMEIESDPLVLEAQKLEKKSEEVSTKIKEADVVISHQVKWENFMVGITNKPFSRSVELKQLIRSGVPHEYREIIWKSCVNLHVGNFREEVGAKYYKDLVSRAKHISLIDPASKQIELDLLRTLPNNKHYESSDSEGVTKLRRVLSAYNCHNPTIGYCQGMNRLVAIILLFMGEEETFWCLVAIVDFIMPRDYYSRTLVAAQADQRVLKDLIQEKLPRVYNHFDSHGVDLSLFTFNWFLTIFVDNIPTETFLRIWDSFLYEGSKVLFRYALAFFKTVEEDILKANGPLELNHYMRTMGEKMSNIHQISQIAFQGMNPFPLKSITNKRQVYINQVKAELEDLDRLRASLNRSNENENRNGFYFSDEEAD